jgi:hypothetical protein
MATTTKTVRSRKRNRRDRVSCILGPPKLTRMRRRNTLYDDTNPASGSLLLGEPPHRYDAEVRRADGVQ